MIPISQTIDVRSLKSSAAIVEIGRTVSSQNAVAIEPSDSNTRLATVYDFGDQASSNKTIEVQPLPAVWDAQANIRFKQLARDEALRDLSAEEMLELEDLSKLRRRAKHPRSADEILWHRRQQKFTGALVEALKNYVNFLHGPNHP